MIRVLTHRAGVLRAVVVQLGKNLKHDAFFVCLFFSHPVQYPRRTLPLPPRSNSNPASHNRRSSVLPTTAGALISTAVTINTTPSSFASNTLIYALPSALRTRVLHMWLVRENMAQTDAPFWSIDRTGYHGIVECVINSSKMLRCMWIFS